MATHPTMTTVPAAVSPAGSGFPYPRRADTAHPPHTRADSPDSDRDVLYDSLDSNPNKIITSAPEASFRLGYFDVMCLVFNRMIGSGIFSYPQLVMKATDNTGAALMLWFVGILYCLAGMHVYIEYGLNVPRYSIHGVEQSVPRSGGDLNYVRNTLP